MKLIRCYIENFGKLQAYSLEFSPEITVIKEPNGFGKSTLAAFIRSMFYGMPRAAKSLDKNDRKHYQPWQGGVYGGWLEFEHDGTAYRVERSFGPVPKQDTFKLYSLNPFVPSDRYTENLGEEIFGLNADSFDRTTYLPQGQLDDGFVTSEMQARLTNLIENTNDAGDYDSALQSLRTQRSKYLPYRGRGGSINQAAERLAELEAQSYTASERRLELQQVQGRLVAAEEACRTKQKELEQTRMAIAEAYEAASQNLMAQQYADMTAQLQSARSQRNRLQLDYPAGLPTDEEMAAISDAVVHIEQAEAWSLYPNEQQTYEKLDKFFASGVPTETELGAMEEDLRSLTHVQNTINADSAALEKLHPEKKRKSTLILILLTLMIVAVDTYFFTHQMKALCQATCCFIAAFVLLTFISILINGARKRKIRKLTKAIEANQKTADGLTEALHKGLGAYIVSGYELPVILGEIRKNRPIYLELRDKQEMMVEQRAIQQAEALETVSAMIEKYRLSGIGCDRHGLVRLQEARAQWNSADAVVQQAEEQIARFELLHGRPALQSLTQTAAELKPVEQQLSAELTELQEELSALRQSAALLQADVDRCAMVEDEITRLHERQTAELAKVRALDKTIEHLTAARESLTGRYINPLKQRFTEYLNEFMQINPSAVGLDTDYSITLEQQGAQRELGHFSVGQADIIALCMRFALLDVLYGNTAPLLILDDPFVNLDNANLQTALETLRKLSRNHQILYLTCHDSRIA